MLALTEFMSEKRNNGNFPLKKVASGGRNTYTENYKNLIGLKRNWNMFVYFFEQIRFAKNDITKFREMIRLPKKKKDNAEILREYCKESDFIIISGFVLYTLIFINIFLHLRNLI